MYSEQIARFVENLEEEAGAAEDSGFLDRLFTCLLEALSERLGASCEPRGDFLSASVSLLMISEVVSAQEDADSDLDGVHYLLGLGFEYTSGGERWRELASSAALARDVDTDALERLVLCSLHYLAGGFRVQALAALNTLRELITVDDLDWHELRTGVEQLHRGAPVVPENPWSALFFGLVEPATAFQRVAHGLGRAIRRRHRSMLGDLGAEDAQTWLASRGIGEAAAAFWREYVQLLSRRGITSFTPEQVGPGFDQWLIPDADLLVVLPTGSGKSVVGELRTALALAEGRSVAWLLPTRALVRQTKRMLRQAFVGLGVVVQELPTTEDFEPLFGELEQGRVVAATTPERLSALCRANPGALTGVRTLVFDEAQLLTDKRRGIAAEQVLSELRASAPHCRFICNPLTSGVLSGAAGRGRRASRRRALL